MRRRNARGGISRTVSVYLDEDTNNRLIRAKDRSGRSKTIEVQIRLRDHLKRFPDFYNEEIFREVIEENESTFKELWFLSINIKQRNHMNTVLSVQGASAPVKKKSFFSKFTRLNMLRLARAVIPAAVLMMFFPQLAMAAQGQDLMQSGNSTVKATFGKDSSVVKWVVLAEVLVGAVMYMMTKNVKFLAGFAIISVFIAVGMAVVGL